VYVFIGYDCEVGVGVSIGCYMMFVLEVRIIGFDYNFEEFG